MHEIKIKEKKDGFTLVELLVYMMLFGIVLTAISTLFISNTRSHTSQQNSMEMNQDLRGAMDLMVREIRMAAYDPTDSGLFGFINGGSGTDDTDVDSINFTTDYDEDGATGGTNEAINYYLYTSDGIQKLGRNVSGTLNPVAESITALAFTYIDANGAVITPPLSAAGLTNIRTVQISITAQTTDPDPLTKQRKTRTMTSRVRVRNL